MKVKENEEAIRFEEIRLEILDLVEEALKLLPRTSMDYERAKAYWYAHIKSAVGHENYLTYSTTMSSTYKSLIEI